MDWWQQLLAKYASDVDDRLLFTVGTWLVHISIFWGFNTFLLLCRHNRWFDAQRIDVTHNPEPVLVQECVKKLLLSHFVLQPIGLYFIYPYFAVMGLSVRDPIPAWYIIVRDFVVTGKPLLVCMMIIYCFI